MSCGQPIDNRVGVKYYYNGEHAVRYAPNVPADMGVNDVLYETSHQWTNVRGYGNVIVYNENVGEKPAKLVVGFKAYPYQNEEANMRRYSHL